MGFKFTLNDIDSTSDVMISNFTFRFPPATGFMYHVPTFAIFDDETNARWNTNFKNGKPFDSDNLEYLFTFKFIYSENAKFCEIFTLLFS